MFVMGIIHFGCSDRQRLSRQVLENGRWGVVVCQSWCLHLGILQGLEVGTSWWRELHEQNPGEGQKTPGVVQLCCVAGCDGAGWGAESLEEVSWG